MNTTKLQFLTDRSATIGSKLAAKLDAGRIPNAAEMTFFGTCMDQLAKMAPAHELRVLATKLEEAVTVAAAKRSLWLKGRELALKQAKVRQVAKAQARKEASAAGRPNNQGARALIAEMSAHAGLPRTNKQGLPFVVQLPLEWQNAAVA